ncbi:MAG: type II secretion system F family protein [Bacteroidia bacterium]
MIKAAVQNKAKISGGTEKEVGFLQKDIQLFGSSFNDKKKERYYSELNILFAAGVDIRSALELIANEQAKEKEKKLFLQIHDAIVAGSTLSAAMKETDLFSDYEIFSLRIGEESGKLTEILKELSGFFSKKIKQKRQVTSALSYPLIVFIASTGAITFMMKFVVPMFSDVFKRFKGELPGFTKFIIHLSDLFSDYFLYMFLSLLAVIVFLYAQRKAVWFRDYGSRFILKVPVIRDMIAKIYLARFCQSMNLLISARTPLVIALELVSKMTGFYPIEVSLVKVREDVLKGVPLHESLGKFKIYDRRMVSLIKVAEEVNQMDTMFGKLAKQYSDDVEHQTAILGSLIEPLMIIFLGVLVAVILVAMYLPMFQMSSTVG